ncbi:MAG: hypothetical protein Q8930_03620 [Bacillota bacterium]|nr:hypothetical protein [Bacillota bacterium]
MNFFKKDKPKILQERNEKDCITNIQYYRLKDAEGYKLRLLMELTDSGTCFAVIDEQFLYGEQNRAYISGTDKLIRMLKEKDIPFRNLNVKRRKDTAVLGITIRQNGDNLYESVVVGLIIKKDNFETARSLLNSYNINYFINPEKLDEAELFRRFEASKGNMDEFQEEFGIKIFDDIFVENISITVIDTKIYSPEYIRDILISR